MGRALRRDEGTVRSVDGTRNYDDAAKGNVVPHRAIPEFSSGKPPNCHSNDAARGAMNAVISAV